MHHIKIHTTLFTLFFCAFLGINPFATAETAKDAAWYTGGPWDTQLFSEDIPAIITAANANHYTGEKEPVTIFLNEGNANFRADGSLETRSVLVYRIENDDGVRNWSDIQLSWSPWHQDSPKLRVRIINPDGKTYNLTEKDLIVVTSDSDEDQMYSDQKKLKAPYPNVTIGSLIEEEYSRVSRPYIASSGIETQWGFSRTTVVGLNRYTISYPSGTSINYTESDMGSIQPVKSTRNSVNYITWEIRNTPPAPAWEEYVPPDTRQRPVVSVGNAESWASLAGIYAAECEKIFSQKPFVLPKDLKLPGNDAKEATLAASRWINARVRYTGMELGDNSIIPYPPETVVSRGYGDCKDKASLLVAILRAAGYKAWLSLLQAGPGWDIDPTLCGITRFNHAIVYVGDKDGFWFDPTVEINRNTDLPFQDQYRYTLIARPGQKELSRTPASTSAQNLVTEYRTYTMSDNGKGSIVETTEYSGALDTYYRNIQPYKDIKEASKNLETYLKQYYESTKGTKTEWSDPRDLTKPFSMTVTGLETSRANTGYNTAEVAFHLNNLSSNLPNTLLDEKAQKRTQPFRFNLPAAYKLVCTIKPPLGFQPRSIPDPLKIDTRDYLFTRSWESLPNGNFQGTTYFEIRTVEFTAEQYEAFRKDVKKLIDDQYQQIITFDHQGELLRAEGHYTEAFAAYRKILEENPDSAIQNMRLSQALESYSLGQTAIFYARKATELEPKNADMWDNLATLLMNDCLGRRLVSGYDRDGAIAAWKKTIELDPENKAHQANLAILYEYDKNGERFKNRDDMELARAEYAGLGDALDQYQLQFNFWNVQTRLGNLAEAKKLVPAIKDEAQRNTAMIVTEVLTGNAAPPMKLLEQNLPLEKRQDYLVAAADRLVDLRRYQDAARLIRQAAVANKNADSLENRADMLNKITAHDAASADCSTPEGTVKNFFYDYLGGKETSEQITNRYFSKSFQEVAADIGTIKVKELLDSLFNPMIGSSSAVLLSDLSQSILRFETSGSDAQGYRLIAWFDGFDTASFAFYLVREGSEYRLVAWDPIYSSMGRQIIKALDAGQNESATTWYNWIFQPSKNQYASSLGLAFFTDERIPRTPWLMRLVSEMLVIDDKNRKDAPASIDALWQKISDRDRFLTEAAAQKVPAEYQAGLWNVLAICIADNGIKQLAFDQVKTIAEKLQPQLKDNEQFIIWYAVNRPLWGEESQAESTMESFMETNPEDKVAFNALLGIYQMALNFPKLDALTAKYPSRLTGMNLNNLAWDELFRNPDGSLLPIALERSRKAVNLSQSKSRPELHTLATIYSTIGRFDEAHSVLTKLMELNPDKAPSSDDWYIIGLISDGYGFHDAAKEAWSKVVRDEDAAPRKTDTFILAQKKLH